jgi:RNA polymerase sigma-70 factor (ECF subfamily)
MLRDFAEVLAGCKAGDQAAFAALYRAFQPPLLRYLRLAVGQASEDVAGETWYEVARGIERFEGDEGGFRGWLFTIARRRQLDFARAAMRRPSDPVPTESLAHVQAVDDPAASASESAATAEALALIATLPPDQAEVVALRAIAGLDVAQVAELLGKRPGAVRVAAHRGLRRLAERLAERIPAEV